MKYVTLNNGVEMPIVGYGVYRVPPEETKDHVLMALDAGYRLIDTAQQYRNEAGVGEAIAETDIPRRELFITTKVMSNQGVAESLEASLTKLRTDYIDLVLIHWVMGDDLATYRVLEEYVRAGKIRAIGLSNFYRDAFDEIVSNCEIMPAVNQQETHVFYQNKDLQEQYKEHGIYLEAWSPFGAGRENMFENPTLVEIASKYERSVAQVILNFLIGKDIIVIPKSSNPDRMRENLDVFDFELEAEDVRTIEAMDRGESLFDWF